MVGMGAAVDSCCCVDSDFADINSDIIEIAIAMTDKAVEIITGDQK